MRIVLTANGRTVTAMRDDIITRQAVLNTVEKLYKACEGSASDYHDLLVATFIDLPSPTIYGYDIDCLQFIAVLMRENGITPEEALSRFADYTRMAEWIRSQVLSEIGREIKEQCGIG